MLRLHVSQRTAARTSHLEEGGAGKIWRKKEKKCALLGGGSETLPFRRAAETDSGRGSGVRHFRSRVSDDGGRSGGCLLHQLGALSASHRASSVLCHCGDTQIKRRASPCPRGGGRVIKEALGSSDASREEDVDALSACARWHFYSSSVQCRSFTRRTVGGTWH